MHQVLYNIRVIGTKLHLCQSSKYTETVKATSYFNQKVRFWKSNLGSNLTDFDGLVSMYYRKKKFIFIWFDMKILKNLNLDF